MLQPNLLIVQLLKFQHIGAFQTSARTTVSRAYCEKIWSRFISIYVHWIGHTRFPWNLDLKT